MTLTDSRPIPIKNTAYRLYFDIRKADGTLITTWAGMDTNLSLDGGNFAPATAEATEIQTSGCGYIDLTAAEMNADSVIVKTTVTNVDAVPRFTALAPQEAGDIKVDLQTIGGTAASATFNTILDRVEYQRGHHTVAGSTFYVDGTGGNDSTGNGTRALPYKTISKALIDCTSNAHDLIILLPNAGGGPTTVTETATITISKNYVQIRGVGRDLNVTRSNNGGVFDIQASGVELSGFRVTTFGGASSDAVTISNAADFVRLYRLWIESAHRDAVSINVANRCEVNMCVIVAPARDGVRVSSGAGAGTYNTVSDCTIRDAVGSAVNLQGSDASDCRIQRNVIRDNAVGVTVSSGVLDTVITDNRFINNTTRIADSGTRTMDEWNNLATTTTGYVTTDTLTTGARASINAEVLDVLTVDTFAEPASVPAATSSLKDKLNWIFALARNKLTQTTSTQTLRNDADGGNIATAAVSDTGTTATRNEWT